MDEYTPTLDDALALVGRLSTADKVQLIARVATDVGKVLDKKPRKPVRSLYGFLAHLGPAPSAEAIDAARGSVARLPAR